ncbi:MAG: hypothetical protein ABFR90_10905 [Planctomycetota bacterium]
MRNSAVLSVVLLAVLNILLIGCGHDAQQDTQQETARSVSPTIETNCIVHYYKTNASDYITWQQHGYNPEAGFFTAVSTEPIGTVQCSLQEDDYDSSGQKEESLSDFPGSFWSKDLATILFYSFCAGADLLETESMAAGENIKIEGQWYKSLKTAWPRDVSVTVLQSLVSGRIEWVQLDNSQDGLVWLARCYNLRYNNELDKRIPRAIDVFDIRNGIASRDLMVRFDYKDIRGAQIPEVTD